MDNNRPAHEHIRDLIRHSYAAQKEFDRKEHLAALAQHELDRELGIPAPKHDKEK